MQSHFPQRTTSPISDNGNRQLGSQAASGREAASSSAVDAGQHGVGDEDGRPSGSQLIHRPGAGSTMRTHLHSAPVEDSTLQFEEEHLGAPEGPLPFEVDSDGNIKTDSLPKEIKQLLDAGQRVRNFLPEKIQQLYDNAFFNLLGGDTLKFAAHRSLKAITQELLDVSNAIRGNTQSLIDGQTGQDLSTLKNMMGAVTATNLLGVAVLLARMYHTYNDQTTVGLIKTAFGVAAQAAATMVNGAGTMQLHSIQSVISEARESREKLLSDPRLDLDIQTYFEGEPALLPGRSILEEGIMNQTFGLVRQRDEAERELPSSMEVLKTTSYNLAMTLYSLGLLPSTDVFANLLPGRR